MPRRLSHETRCKADVIWRGRGDVAKETLRQATLGAVTVTDVSWSEMDRETWGGAKRDGAMYRAGLCRLGRG